MSKNEKEPLQSDATANAKPSVTDILNELKNEPPQARVFTGMIQAGGDGKQTLLLAHTNDCGHWAEVPVAAIAGITKLGRVGCVGHEHMAARVTLREPEGDVGMAFMNLANLHHAKLARTQVAMRAQATSMANFDGCPPGQRMDNFGHCVGPLSDQ